MKKLLKMHGRTITVASLVIVAVAVGIGGATFAAIPHSVTKEISACRDNTSGALRVIDAEASATCNTGETGLSWSGAQTAIAAYDYDESDPLGPGVYNASNSRNVASQKIGNYETENSSMAGICMHLSFTPKFVSPQPAYSTYDADGAGSDIVESACGSGYEYFATSAARVSFFFSE
jgi:hypothetical protein